MVVLLREHFTCCSLQGRHGEKRSKPPHWILRLMHGMHLRMAR